MILYHYTPLKNFSQILKDGALKPTSKFNTKLTDEEWEEYSNTFYIPIKKLYICTLSEPTQKGWQEYGLLDLSLEGFTKGDLLLKLKVKEEDLILFSIVRDHKFHSPKEYGYTPEVWKRREIRDSKPELRDKWYNSAIPFRDYNGDYVCPEILIPFSIELQNIIVEKNPML